MLELKNIKKTYIMGDNKVEALKGINLKFRNNEFVSILGPSGCGKTTTLNIIGGLDKYTSGDLLIDGLSTKEYKDSDWDAYRNTTIGFVFQNYNLISHLSILENVEMALSLSGISATERKERATKVLIEVGLKSELKKRPNQLSGGQMQRVAIARALVNDPKILLADEPTGALDSKTSRQIMKLIKEISKNRLVIMVTHNQKIANEYSDRIINLLDGEVVGDSNPATDVVEEGGTLSNRKTSMSFWTAIKSSFKNLVTKRGRTAITAIAGSIGIVGVALVLAISNGMNAYIGDLESDSLAGFPITINSQVQADTFGGAGDRNSIMGNDDSEALEFPEENIVYSYDENESTTMHTNIFTQDVIDHIEDMDDSLYNSISYTTAISLQLVTETSTGSYQLVEVESDGTNNFFGSASAYAELPESQAFVESQYDILSGTYPTSYNEVVLVVDNMNQIDVEILEALGFDIEEEYSFEDFLNQEFKIIPNDVYYTEVEGVYVASTDYAAMYASEDAITLTVTGILRVNEEASSEVLNPGIAYMHTLTEYMLEDSSTSEIVLAQIASPNTNVLTNQEFNDLLSYDSVMKTIGGDSTPISVQIYPVDFESKDLIKEYLDEYNKTIVEDEDMIIYTDLAEQVSNTISSMVDTVTIVLTAFAAISLVVSSIMIGVITYVSVIERTKEIGIMRSLGARKKDISRIFNAETLLIGLTAGILGIVFYGILSLPVNALLANLIGVEGFSQLGVTYAVGLVALSSVLTLISGLIPARIAANKDPVIALRTE